MCLGCFKKHTDEPVINDRVNAAVALLDAAGDEAHWTNLLHIIVEDDNVDDRFFDFEDEDGPELKATYDQAEPWERAIFDVLKPLSEAERATVIALHGRYFDPPVIPKVESGWTIVYPSLAASGFRIIE